MINKLILGTVQFGLDYGINNSRGLMPATEVCKILDFASQAGIQFLDTAADYGDAEKKIGDFTGGQELFKIITKFSKKPDAHWKDSLKQSLENLRVDKVDTIMFHSFQSYLDAKPLLSDMLVEGKNKWFNKIGVSVYTNEELEELCNDDLIEVVQCPFNLLDNHYQRALQLEKLKATNKIIHTRSVFLQGLFLMHPEKIPFKLSPLIKHLAQLHCIAQQHDLLSMGHLALQYVLGKKYIDGVLIGVDSFEQLQTNIKWSRSPIEPEILSMIDEIIVSKINLLNPSNW